MSERRASSGEILSSALARYSLLINPSRLRMSFIDISNNGAPGPNRGKASILAWTFSDKFQVYSAKKFPGVIESTPLSKTFASQGIKIPIRKDNKNEAADDEEGD